MNCPQRIGCALIALTLVALEAGSLEGQERFDFFREWKWVDFPSEVLPAGPVQEMAEVVGVPWVRTAQGVAFFDGFQWIELGPDRGLAWGRNVTSLAKDGGDGVLIVAGGTLYQGDTVGVRPLLTSEGLEFGTLQKAFPNPGGGLFLTTSQEGMDSGRALIFRDGEIQDVSPPRGLTQGGRQVWSSSGDRVWAHSLEGLAVWEGTRWEVMEEPHTEYREVTVLAENSRGEGFAFRSRPFSEKGLLRWGGQGRPNLDEGEGRNDLLSGDVAEDGSFVMIWGTGHIRIFKEGVWSTIEIPSQRSQGLYFVHLPPSGDRWFASAQGLHWYRESSLGRWTQYVGRFPDPWNRVNAILPRSDEVVWAGSERGVTRYVPSQEPTRFPSLGPHRDPVVTTLAADSSGGIWAASGLSFPGAYRWDGEGWKHVGEGILGEEDAQVGTVHSIRVDGSGGVWLLALGGGQGEQGVFRFEGGVLWKWMDPEGWLDSPAYALAEGPEGSLWFGNRNGLARLHEESWSYWGRPEGVGNGFDPYVQDLVVDERGQPWFVHGPDIQAGLGTLTESGEIKYFKREDGLPSNHLRAVALDENGWLWVTSSSGIGFLRNGFWNTLDGRHGLDPVSVWPVAWTQGGILFGTLGGGIQVLSRIEETSPPPRVVLAPPVVEENVVYLNWVAFSHEGELPADQVLTRFRVDDSPWTEWSVEHVGVLGALSPGRHRVEVQARGLFGQFSSEGVRDTFQIPLPLHRQPLFAIPMGLLLLLLLGGITAYWHRKRQADEALRESEERMRTLVESAPEAIAIYDVEARRFIEANSNCGLLFGMSTHEFLSAPVRSLNPPLQPDGRRSLAVALELLQETLEGGRPVTQWDILRSDGSTRHCELSLVPLPRRDRSLIRFSLVDISERLQAQAREKELEARLFQSQKLEAVGQLTGGVAHDFNNLLTVVLGNLELLKEDLPPGSPLLEGANGASEAAERGALLTQRLLAFSRRQALEPRLLHVGELIPGLLQILRRTLGEDISIETVVTESPWPIRADPAQLESAILNLAINARDAMPSGGDLTIEAMNTRLDDEANEELEAGDYLVVAVSDTGTGIPAEVIPQVFDPFFTTKEVGKGSGLGLSMVYGFTVQSGGTTRIYSEKGLGTTVRLYFPRSDEGVSEARTRTAEDVIWEGRGERILLVEDDSSVRKTSTTLLTRLGYEVVEAGTGSEALEILGSDSQPIHLLLSDIVLPGEMNGVELARKARAIRPDLPVLFTSGYTEEAVLREGRLDPGFELVPKPFNRTQLGLKVRQTILGEGAPSLDSLDS